MKILPRRTDYYHRGEIDGVGVFAVIGTTIITLFAGTLLVALWYSMIQEVF